MSDQANSLLKGLKGLADFLGVSIPSAYRYKASGQIPYFQIGGKIFFDKEAVLKAIKKGGNP